MMTPIFYRYLLVALGVSLSGWNCRTAPEIDPNPVKSAVSDKGMVVTAHPIASEVGLEILRQGGNAADAAIAVQFALAVVYPRAGNLGGGGFLMYRDKSGEVISLDYREQAPIAASRDMYLDSAGQVIPNRSTSGIFAAGIPGTVAGLVETHKRFGSIQPWSRLVEPAIRLAEEGFRLTANEAERLNAYQSQFREFNSPGMPFLADSLWKEGDLLVQKELASTLRHIANEGKDGFYAGENARALVTLSVQKNGLFTEKDLQSYQAKWRPPVTIHWRDLEIHSMGPPSSGGIILGEILGMIENKLVDSLGNLSSSNIHLLIEAERRAYADRAKYLGDDDFYPVMTDSLLDRQYLAAKFSDFDPKKASESKSISAEKIEFARDHFETTHLSIIDQWGNAAAVTTTLNDNYGCKVWVPGGGYFLNNEMDDFSIKPGVPNIFGLIGGEANAIAPGKRMLSSMSPTIVEKNNEVWLVLGSPGGSTIITTVAQVLVNIVAYGMDPEAAVRGPRFHHQWLPEEILFEKNGFSPTLIQQLESMGHSCKWIDNLGDVELIQRDDQGLLHGVADARGVDDHAAGW